MEAGVLGDGIYFSTTAFRYMGKGHLAYYTRILHGDSSGSIFQRPPLEGGWWAFKEDPYNAQTNQLDCHRHGLRGLTGLLIEVAGSYKHLTFDPLVL